MQLACQRSRGNRRNPSGHEKIMRNDHKPLSEMPAIGQNSVVSIRGFVSGGSFSMHRLMIARALTATALLVGTAFAGDGLKSGPQVGSKKILPFNPEHANGPDAGTKLCLV
jgi:hypothetical protein